MVNKKIENNDFDEQFNNAIDMVIDQIIKDEIYLDAVIFYYCIELTEKQKDKLEPIVMAARILGIEPAAFLKKGDQNV